MNESWIAEGFGLVALILAPFLFIHQARVAYKNQWGNPSLILGNLVVATAAGFVTLFLDIPILLYLLGVLK